MLGTGAPKRSGGVASRAASWAGLGPSTTAVAWPRRCARSRIGAPGTSLTTSARSASVTEVANASMSRSALEPRPEPRMANRGLDMAEIDLPGAGNDLSDPEPAERFPGGGVIRSDHGEEAEAHVEGGGHLRRRHPAAGPDQFEDRRSGGGVGGDEGRQEARRP